MLVVWFCAAQDYLSAVAGPLLTTLVSSAAQYRPADVPQFFVDALNGKDLGEPTGAFNPDDKVYIDEYITPVLKPLLKRMAVEKPAKPADFLKANLK